MTARELLGTLRQLGVRLWVEEGQWLRYNAPRGVLTPDLLGRLKEHKTEILGLLGEARRLTASNLPPIEPVDRSRGVPLSFAQQRLWFLSQLHNEGAAYNIPLAWRVTGELDVVALRRTYSEIVRRHEALRTTYATVEGVALQFVAAPVEVELEVVDLTGLAEDQRRKRADRLISELFASSFDLTKDVLVRPLLVKIGDRDYALATAIHHIAFDGWSVGVFASELSALYAAFARGEPSPLPELAIQYRDFAQWQRKWLQGDLLEKHLDYWRDRLASAPHVLDLPTDHARPPIQTHNGRLTEFEIEPRLLERIKSVSQLLGVTPFPVLLAVFKVLLWRYSGVEDICVGTPIAGRTLREVEPIIGFFANTLVLRTDLGGNPTFRELVERVREVTVGAMAHQDLPFERLVEELKPDRDVSRNPLVQVLFVQQNAIKGSVSLPGLELAPWGGEITSVRFDLELHFWDSADGLLGTFIHNTDLFESETVTRMAEQYRRLLAAAVDNPQLRIADLPLMDEAERDRLVSASIASATGGNWEPVHVSFKRQAAVVPDVTAVRGSATTLSYADVAMRVDAVAGELRRLGIGDGSRVGVAMQDPVAQVVAILAVLETGAAFVPLDVRDPRRWNERVVRRAGAAVTLSDVIQPQDFPGILVLSPGGVCPSSCGGLSPASRRGGLSPGIACVTFAGGRGVAIDHEGLARRVAVAAERRTHVDWAGIALLAPLVRGEALDLGTSRAVGAAAARDARAPAAHLATGWSRQGDGLAVETGLTEIGFDEVAGRLVARRDRTLTAHGVSCFVLDSQLRPLPPGVPGDLYLGGSGVAAGYFGDDAATRASFVADPFRAGGRLFRTGVRARLSHCGVVRLMASHDGNMSTFQQSVDVTEIERAILAEPSVVDCAVVVRDVPDEATKLVAYVATANGLDSHQLSAHLANTLPARLRPDVLVPVYGLPLTSSGEVDCVALQSIRVIEDATLAACESTLTAIVGDGNVAVVAREPQFKPQRLYLPELLPARNSEAGQVTVEPAVAATQPAGSARLAYADGGRLALPETAPPTLADALERVARELPDRGITYVLADGREEYQTYASLLDEALRILTGLCERGLRPGDRAVLQTQSLRDHFPVFWACVLGGITPVAVAVAPTYEEDNAVVRKLFNAWQLLGRPVVLASGGLVDAVSGLARLLPMEELEVVAIDRLRDNERAVERHCCRPEDVLFLQLTSGSTGVPKCIQITHRGVIHHSYGSKLFNGYGDCETTLNWLPMDHVVPILTCHLRDVCLGYRQVAVTTAIVLANPLAWLDLIEKHRASLTWSPNFGFKLVSDALARARGRSWDLSSIRYFMNAGEQVTLPVVREFLANLAPFGVAEQAMQPAFGMAEACTCMTYRNDFDCDGGVRRIKKSTLGGRLQVADAADPDAVAFVDLGGVIPGVEIRIADASNNTLPEGVIGRLQIRGAVVTPGYLNNDQANAEAFVGDGWFNSGDLGYMLDGRLTLTGREKELIIVHGANFYCYEIEDVVSEVEGVEPTFVAACGIYDPESGTEGLVVFFVPRLDANAPRDQIPIDLIRRIRTDVTQRLGISPAFVIPLPKPRFPKTTSGKIQRTHLKKEFERGGFREIVRRIELEMESPRTIPDWFFQVGWRPRRRRAGLETGPYLVFAEASMTSEACKLLRDRGERVIEVAAASGYSRLDPDHYRLRPAAMTDYARLLEALAADGVEPAQIVHAWTCAPTSATTLAGVAEAQDRGMKSLVALAGALVARVPVRPVTLRVASVLSRLAAEGDRIACERTPVLGITRTLQQELPWMRCVHVDLEGSADDAGYLAAELQVPAADREVAYRRGARLTPYVVKTAFDTPVSGDPIRRGGFYLISGGLGGIGLELARLLLESYDARLLIVGTADLAADSARHARLESLKRLGGNLAYEAVDIADAARLGDVVMAHEAAWGRLDGVFHLAGKFWERPLAEETSVSLDEMFRGKALGGWALSRLVVERGGLFVSFGSLNGQFGGVNVGAYAAANAFLEGLCNQLTQETGVSSYCLHWSLWDELGIGSTYTKKALSRARGYYALATADGFQSLQVALRYGLSQVLVGLDESRPWIRRAMGVEPYGERCGIVYLSGEGKPPHLTARDALGEPLRLEFTHIEQFPRTADGAIDREQLKLSAGAGLSRGRSLPRTQIEVTLARIYQRVLGISLVGVDDNFFELGGHSLLAVRLLAEIRNALHVELPLDSVIETPTIAGLARSLASRLEAGEAESPLPKYVVALRRGGSRRPFFCVHPASGTSIVFGQLAGFMNPDRPFYGFQCPGLTDDQPLLETVEQQAALYVAAMREVTPGPYLLGGWSAGGPVVFEMARMLEAQGQEVRFLALLDCGLLESDVPSGARRKLSPTATLKGTLMLLRFARWMGMPKSYADWRALAAMGGIALPVSMRDVTRRPVVEQLRFLRGLNAEILRFTRIFRINTKAGIDYKPQPYGGKVTVLRTAQRVDPDPILADLHKYAAEVDYLKIDGNHMSIIFDANDSRALAHRLDECMEGM